MTVTIDTAALSAALKHAAAVTESRNTVPILSNVRLMTEGDELEVVTTDLDCEFRQRVAVSSGSSLATTVDAKRLSAIAGAAAKGSQITLELDGARLAVKTGRSHFLLPALPTDDFPEIPFDIAMPPLELSGTDLARAITLASPSISTEPAKYYLNGVLFNPEAGKLRLASTDGHRLAAIDLAIDWPEDAPEVIVPTKFVRLLQQLCAEQKAITLQWDDRKIRARFDGVCLTGKLIDGTFPDYRRVIPKPVSEPILADPEQLCAALRRIQLVGTSKTRAAKLTTGEGKLDLSVTDPDGGNACEEVPAECSPGHETGFNVAYLAAALETVGGDTVEIHHENAGAPCLIRRKSGGDALVTVMPMRV